MVLLVIVYCIFYLFCWPLHLHIFLIALHEIFLCCFAGFNCLHWVIIFHNKYWELALSIWPFCFQISSRLFIDSGTRRSTRLSGDAGFNTNAASTAVAGNGTSNSSKYLGGSKLGSMSLRSMTNRKGQAWANENMDEGDASLYLSFIW